MQVRSLCHLDNKGHKSMQTIFFRLLFRRRPIFRPLYLPLLPELEGNAHLDRSPTDEGQDVGYNGSCGVLDTLRPVPPLCILETQPSLLDPTILLANIPPAKRTHFGWH